MVLEKEIINYDKLQSDYPILYEMLLSMLENYQICTDPYFYVYLNKEYDLSEVMITVFGVVNIPLTFDLIINWCISTIQSTEYEYLFNINKKTKENYKTISNVIRDTFFVNELEFLSLVVNIIWKNDLNQFGYIKESSFEFYKNCKLIF